MGHAVAHLVEALHYKPGETRVRFSVWSLRYFIDLTLGYHCGLGFDSVSKRNGY